LFAPMEEVFAYKDSLSPKKHVSSFRLKGLSSYSQHSRLLKNLGPTRQVMIPPGPLPASLSRFAVKTTPTSKLDQNRRKSGVYRPRDLSDAELPSLKKLSLDPLDFPSQRTDVLGQHRPCMSSSLYLIYPCVNSPFLLPSCFFSHLPKLHARSPYLTGTPLPRVK